MNVKNYEQLNLFGLKPKQLYPFEFVEKGKIVVLVPVYQMKSVGWFRQKTDKTYLRFKLDLLGSFVWDHCNGRKTVQEIADRMKAEYGTYAEPVDERVGSFIQRLRRERLIDLSFVKEEKLNF